MMTTKISWGFNISDMGKIISAESQVTFDPRGKEWRVLVAMQFPDAAILGFPHVFNINSQLFVTRLWFYHTNLFFFHMLTIKPMAFGGCLVDFSGL